MNNFKNYLQKTKNMYEDSMARYGKGPGALRWYSRHSMDIRFRQLVADVDFKGKSILDVGCGFGDIIPFIEQKADGFDYLGVDVVEKFVKKAAENFSDYRFEQRNYFGNPPDQKFNIVLTSGTLNGNVGSPRKTMEFRKEAIRQMWESADKAVVFNMAGNHPQPKNEVDSDLFYVDYFDVLKFVGEITPKIVFRYGYEPDDFTVAMFK